MRKDWAFDRPWVREFTKARQTVLQQLVGGFRHQMHLSSALDVGCGVGDFSKLLADLGFAVVAVDGRQENVDEARKRFPEITFAVADAEELRSANLGTFDLVLCFGLLYHLENPFRTIRQLYSSTGQVLLLEGICVPDAKPTMSLFDEATVEDQGLNYVAFYPSEACLIKMLYRSGFPFVYQVREFPEDPLYIRSVWRKRVRTFLVASRVGLKAPNLVLSEELFFMPPDTSSVWSKSAWNPWTTRATEFVGFLRHLILRAHSIVSRVVRAR